MKKRKLMKRVILFSVVLGSFFGLSKVGLADANYGIQSVLDEETIAQTIEQNNATMGSSIKNNNGMSTFGMSLFSTATDTSLPNKDFIDVSSWNGAITVDQYKKMKSYGVKGVVVKLSEGTYYLNPQRFVQIKNAQAAGLTVSVYHYSKFSTATAAKNEANYFANAAANTGLAKNTIFVNDAEDSAMASGNVTNNSVIFANTLKGRGYSNVVHYSMADWITTAKPKLNPNVLGKSNIWVAQYPYKPSKNKLLHTDYAAWQWASDMKFPGVATPIGGSFDINIDYSGRFTINNLDSVTQESKTSFRAQIKEAAISDKHGLWEDVYNTRGGIKYLGKGSKFANKAVTIEATATTKRSTYWKFKVNGQVYWLDKAAFTPKLYTVVKSDQVNYKAVVKPKNESSKQGLWNTPWNTAENAKSLGNGGSYAGKTVQISKIVTLNTGTVYYEFKNNGKVVGYLDKKAFYEIKQSEIVTSYRAKINSNAKSQGVWSAPYNTASGIKGYGNAGRYVGKTVGISGRVKTARSTYLQTTLDGKKVWVDQKAFTPTLYQIKKTEQVNYQVVVKPKNDAKKQGIWSAPWNTTTDGKYLGTGEAYAGKTVQISRIVTLNTGTVYYEFKVNGKVVGWLDRKAFYEPKISEKSVKYEVEVVAAAKHQGVWSAPYNTQANIKGFGKGAQYIGKRGTVDKVVQTTRSTYWRVTIAGKTVWIDGVSFKQITQKAATRSTIEEKSGETSTSSSVSTETTDTSVEESTAIIESEETSESDQPISESTTEESTSDSTSESTFDSETQETTESIVSLNETLATEEAK